MKKEMKKKQMIMAELPRIVVSFAIAFLWLTTMAGFETPQPCSAAEQKLSQLYISIENSDVMGFQTLFKAEGLAESPQKAQVVKTILLKKAKEVLDKRSQPSRNWFDWLRIPMGLGLMAFFYINDHWAIEPAKLENLPRALETAQCQSDNYPYDMRLKANVEDARNDLWWGKTYNRIDWALWGIGCLAGVYLFLEGYAGSNQQSLFKRAYTIVKIIEKSMES